MRRRVNVGREFEISKLELLRESARSRIAFVLIVACAGFVIGAGILGLVEGSFEKLNSVWIGIGPLMGALVTYYFGPRAQEPPNDS